MEAGTDERRGMASADGEKVSFQSNFGKCLPPTNDTKPQKILDLSMVIGG
jgi:hypothetical protein